MPPNFMASDDILGQINATVDATEQRVANQENIESKKISNDQELIQSDPISCPQNQKGNN